MSDLRAAWNDFVQTLARAVRAPDVVAWLARWDHRHWLVAGLWAVALALLIAWIVLPAATCIQQGGSLYLFRYSQFGKATEVRCEYGPPRPR